MKRARNLILLVFLISLYSHAYGEKEVTAEVSTKQTVETDPAEELTTDELLNMDLADLLEMEVSVASYETTPIREQPGIITIITREQIERTGARDLMDVLNLVPGFRFAGECIAAGER